MPFEVLVVLGCRIHDGRLSPAALRRVERAAQAYHEHGASLVVASGGKRWQGVMESEVFVHELAARGVPRSRLLPERRSLTTLGNAREVARLLSDRAASGVAVVTCDWHMPRALRLFRHCGLDAVPLPAVSPAPAWHATSSRWLRERASLTLDLCLASWGKS